MTDPFLAVLGKLAPIAVTDEERDRFVQRIAATDVGRLVRAIQAGVVMPFDHMTYGALDAMVREAIDIAITDGVPEIGAMETGDADSDDDSPADSPIIEGHPDVRPDDDDIDIEVLGAMGEVIEELQKKGHKVYGDG